LEEFGNTVIVKHDNDIITSYAHLRDINVKNGAAVHRGDVIGSVGKTGDVTEPQLHFEILKNKMPINPSKYLD
jgi:murein DD-endopeptidase MepM/ murein hydrolase activator NlpD